MSQKKTIQSEDQILSSAYNHRERALDVVIKNSSAPFSYQRNEFQYGVGDLSSEIVKIEYYGNGVAQEVLFLNFRIKAVNNSQYYVLYSALDEEIYHVWINWAGTGVDPAPVGSIGIEVLIQPWFTQIGQLNAMSKAIEATTRFKCRIHTEGLSIINSRYGITSSPEVGTLSATLRVMLKGEAMYRVGELYLEYNVDNQLSATERY